jgi:hypothetical protein
LEVAETFIKFYNRVIKPVIEDLLIKALIINDFPGCGFDDSNIPDDVGDCYELDQKDEEL